MISCSCLGAVVDLAYAAGFDQKFDQEVEGASARSGAGRSIKSSACEIIRWPNPLSWHRPCLVPHTSLFGVTRSLCSFAKGGNKLTTMVSVLTLSFGDLTLVG